MSEEFPQVDAIILGHVLMDWPIETKKMLIKKAYTALNKGGFVLIYDEILDNERCKNTNSFLVSIHM